MGTRRLVSLTIVASSTVTAASAVPIMRGSHLRQCSTSGRSGTDLTALFVIGLVMCSLFLAPFGQGTAGWVLELFPTECRATGFCVASFIGGIGAFF